MFRPALILTRPLAQAEDFARAFRARFGAEWPVILSPLTEIRFLNRELPTTGCDAIVFTSANAVTAFCRISPVRDLPAFCVGPRTAEVARAAGFDGRQGPGDGVRLMAEISAMNPSRIAWPRGTEVAADIEEIHYPGLQDLIPCETPTPALAQAISESGGLPEII